MNGGSRKNSDVEDREKRAIKAGQAAAEKYKKGWV